MQALVVAAPGHYAIQEVPTPRPGPGQVLIRSRAVGVSRSLIDVLEGKLRPEWVRYPVIPGHEWSGVAADLGEGVTSCAVGDKVVVEGLVYCGTCQFCRRGLTNLCEAGAQIGFTQSGGCAEYVAVPARLVHRLPPSISFEAASLIEPTAVVARGVLRAQPSPGDTVAVVGAGTVGLLAVMLMRMYWPARLVLIGFSDQALAMGRELGATEVINPRRTDPVEAVRQLTGGTGLDLVIEAAGTTEALETTLEAVREGGRAVLLGIPGAQARAVMYERVVAKDLEVHGVQGYTTDVWSRVVRLVASGALQLEAVVRHRFPLARFADALSQYHSPENGTGRIILYP